MEHPVMKKPHKPGQGGRANRKDECTIPPALPLSMLPNLTFNQPKHEERAVREYVEWQANDEKVIHAEKVGTEHLLGRTLTAWDVRTDKNRWWVITNPTNLYSQELFPSLDYTITLHIGLATRMTARHAAPTSQGQRDRIIAVWRRWEQ